MTQQCYSPAQVARIVGKSEHAIRAMIRRGKLKAARWGRSVIVLAEDLDHLIRTLRMNPIRPRR